jgi:hypothetical protein
MLVEPKHHALLRETVARHFPDARIDGETIHLGFGDVQMSCRVDNAFEKGRIWIAALFFHVRSGRVGGAPVFASVSGYAASAEAAIIEGACQWTCAFGPVLRSGLAGEDISDVPRFEVVVDEQRFRVFVDAFDRALLFEPGDATERIAAARARFCPESWLVRAVLESGRAPLLHSEKPTVVSVFVADGRDSRTVEVKVNGCDWRGMEPIFEAVAQERPGAFAMLRELAVVVPIAPSPGLARTAIARTLEGLTEKREVVAWPGWSHHEGRLEAPLSGEQLATLEARVGKLPAEYRAFVTEVAASGAGPGYGLMSPMGELHSRCAKGAFAWEDESKPTSGVSGAIPIAHAGCGVMWLLVIAGPHAGEVWLDARSSDGSVRRAAASFSAWYRDWLSAAVQDAQPWLQWNPNGCATAGVLSQLLTAMEREGISGDSLAAEVPKRFKPGAIMLAATGSDYFADQATLNPCQGCTALASRFGLTADVFQRADEPKLDGTDEPRKGWFSRLGAKLRSR